MLYDLSYYNLDFFYQFYYLTTYVLLIVLSFFYLSEDKDDVAIFYLRNYIAFSFVLFVVLFIGMRPITYGFADMNNYYRKLVRCAEFNECYFSKEWAFDAYVWVMSFFKSERAYFFILSLFYIVPLLLFARIWSKKKWPYLFAILICSFSFLAFGVTGIRSGISSSLFLLGFLMTGRKRWFWFLLSFGFHASIALPVLATIVSSKYKNTKAYLLFWVFSIFLVILFPNTFISLFSFFGEDSSYAYLLNEQDDTKFSRVGFRIDFVLYSFIGVASGLFAIYKLGITNDRYKHLFNIYLICNSFWILVMHANFSVRIAFLSWFMIGIIYIAPWLEDNTKGNAKLITTVLMIAYGTFTFLMART